MRGREFGNGLRASLRRAGFTVSGMAELLGWDRAKLSSLLSGKGGVTEVELANLLGSCHTPPEEREHLQALFREANARGWLQQFGSRLPIQLRTLIDHENAAIELISWQMNLVHGLLQTPDYMREVIRAGANMLEAEVEERVVARLARQKVIDRWLQCTFYIHEQALRLPVGGQVTMSEQLHHMLRMSVRPNITLRIVPTAVGAHAGLAGAFTLMKFKGIEPVVNVENENSSVFVEDKEPVAGYKKILQSLDQVALGEAESRRLITEIAS